MRIWLINHYAVPIQYYPLARTTNFAKYLMRMGHEVTIFAASAVHNSTVNLIEDGSLFREEYVDGIHYVYVRCRSYTGNGIGRISNMFEFAWRLESVCEQFPKPDAVLASSATPMACKEGLKLAKKYGVRAVAEVTDLWPESFVAYGLLSKYNPILIPMYHYEKKMYEYADEIVFSMEGAYDYIEDRGWQGSIPRAKIHYINNGVDLETFDYNKEHYTVDDEDLRDSETFKVIYVGSIRLVNNIGKLIDVAKRIKNPRIKFLLWGKGDELKMLQQLVIDEKIENVAFKGYVDKKYVPYIASQADLNIVSFLPASVDEKYGISPNKMFDYMAAGKPILTVFPSKYNPAVQIGAGEGVQSPSVENIAAAVVRFADMDGETYAKYCQNARKGAQQYDFKRLTEDLLAIMMQNRNMARKNIRRDNTWNLST